MRHSCNWRHKPFEGHKTWNSKATRIAHEREVELRELQDQSAAQRQLLKAPWKNQTSQQATYKAETHALNTEIANMAEKPELQAMLPAKTRGIDSPRPTVHAAPDNVLNTVEHHGFYQQSTCRINDTDETKDADAQWGRQLREAQAQYIYMT